MNGILVKPWKVKFIAEHPDIELMTRRLGGLKEINLEPDKWELIRRNDDGRFLFWRKSEYASLKFEDPKNIALVKPRYQVGETVYIKETWCESYFGEPIYYKLDGKESPGPKGFWRSPMLLKAINARYFITITDVRAERLQNITEEEAKAEGTNPYLINKLEGGKHYRMIKAYHRENYPLTSHADEGEEIVFECPNMGFARCHHLNWQDGKSPVFRILAKEVFNYIGSLYPDYLKCFRILWNSINKDYSWESNPWVSVYTFRLEQ